jgi:hypothetical protein
VRWNASVCRDAALKGNLDCLIYLHENGCPWDERACEDAAREGHMDCLIYLHECGCPWREKTCKDAIHSNNFECLKYAYENGCPLPYFFDDSLLTRYKPIDPDIIQFILFNHIRITPNLVMVFKEYNEKQERDNGIVKDFFGIDVGKLIIDFFRLFPRDYDIEKENSFVETIATLPYEEEEVDQIIKCNKEEEVTQLSFI